MEKKERMRIRYLALLFVLVPMVSSCAGQQGKTGSGSVAGPVSYSFPLTLRGPGARYLTDTNNQPFFWLGDAAWSMIAQLSSEDIDFYLDDRKSKGFSVLLVSLIEHKFSTGAPADHYGEKPFIDRPFATPNTKYFEHADQALKSAGDRNIIVLLDPLYLGYACGDEGWCDEVRHASQNDLYQWGKFVGNRYKNFNNIIWMIGGDTDPSPVKDKILDMIRGIRENDTIHLFSAHNQPESMAITPWKGESWLTVNNVYSYDSVLYRRFKSAYLLDPVLPYYLCESAYENEHNSKPAQLRSQAYQAVLCGAMGHIFGNCPVWHFGANMAWCNTTDWKSELNDSGSVSMGCFQKLFRSRLWFRLIPDFDHKAVTGGYGTWGMRDYVTAAITDDGRTLIAYLPSPRKITADLSRITGRKASCWWYNPATGRASHIGIFKTSGYQIFTPVSEGDIVLVIDSAEALFQEPGKGD